MTSYTAEERETTIGWTDAEDVISVSTNQRKMITILQKNVNFKEISFNSGVLIGTLPLGAITVRSKMNTKRGSSGAGLKNAAKCGAPTAAGKPCGAIASKETGRCPRHKGVK